MQGSTHPLLRIALLCCLLTGCAPKLAAMPTSEPVTLRFAYPQSTVPMQTLLDEFQTKYPWITVEPFETRPFGDDLDVRLRAGVVDVFRSNREALQYVEDDMLSPLDDIQLGDWADIRDDYYRGAWEGLAVGGVQWGIPAGVDMLVAYVNAQQAEALGVTIPSWNWTLFEFVELTTGLNYPVGLPNSDARLFGFCTTPEGMDAVIFAYLHGGGLVDDINNPTEVTLDAPATIEGVEWYTDLYTRHGLAPDPEIIRTTFRRGGVWEAALRGNCGVWIGWYSDRGGVNEQIKWDFDWTMLPLPRTRADFNLGDIEAYFVTTECAHPKEALMLLRYLADAPQASGKRVPPRKSLVESDAYEDLVGEDAATIARTFGETRVAMLPVSSMAQLEQVAAAFFQAVQMVLNEGIEPADALAEAQVEVRHVLETAPQ